MHMLFCQYLPLDKHTKKCLLLEYPEGHFSRWPEGLPCLARLKPEYFSSLFVTLRELEVGLLLGVSHKAPTSDT